MRRERQHVKRRWSFVGSVKAIVNKVKPSNGDRQNGNFKGITLTTGTHIDLTNNNTKRSQSLYRRSSNENQNSSSHNPVSVSKSVPHTSNSFNHLLSSKQHGPRHGLTREELDEDVRRIVTHSDQKATALKVLKSRLLGDSGHSTGSGAEHTDSDVYLSDDPRNNQPRTLSQQNKPANSKIATSLRRAATSSRDYVKKDKNKKMLKSELFDQADGKKRFMLAATDNSGSILDKYIANARESAWVMGKKTAQQAKYEEKAKESETEESYTASDWSEDTSSCTDESADYSTSGWSSNNSESEEVTASSSESSADEIISSDDHELTPLQSHKNNLKSSISREISTESKLDRKTQQSREIKPELERIPSKPSEVKKLNKLPSKEQTLSGNNMQPTVSSSSTSNRLRPKTPPRRRAPSSHQQKKCSIDEDLDEDDTNKVLALGDLIVQKAVEMNVEIEVEEEEETQETVHETEELVTEYEEEIIEELVTASEEEEELMVLPEDENEMNLKLGDAISSHHSSCSHETSDDEAMEEQTLDTGSGISHEEYREDLMIRPELETIIEEEEENNSPHPRKNRSRKDRKSSYEGAVTFTGNGEKFCSPRFQSRTACFASLSPKSQSALVGSNGTSFVGIPQDVKVNQARERLHMQLGGCAKPCIKLPTADDVVTKPQNQDLKVLKPRPLTPPDLSKLHPSPTLDRVNSYQQAAAGISKPIVIPENLSGKTQVLPKATKALLNDTKTVVQVIEVEETTITRRKKKKDMTDKKSGKEKKGKKQKVQEDVPEPEQLFQSDRIGAQVEMYEEKIELITHEESHVSPKKEKKRIEREQKKRKKLMELIGEEAAKKVLSEDAEVIVVDKQGRRECIQAIKENPIAKVQSNKKPSKSSSKPLKGSKTSSSSSTSSSSRFIPTAGGEMLTTKSSSANSSSASTDRSSPSSYTPSSPEHDDDGWRRESHESSSGVSTMNSDQALTPERNNSLDEHNDSGLPSTPSKSDRSKKPRVRTSDNNNVRAATTTIQAAAQLSALDSVNAILNAKKKDKKSKKASKSSSSSGKQIPMRV